MFTRWSFTARVSNCFIFLAVGQRFCWMESYRWFPCVAPFQQTIHKVYFAVWPLWKLETTFDYRRRPFQVAQLRKAVTQTRVFRWLCISGQGWSFRFNADDDPCNFFGIFIFFFLMVLFLNWWKLRFVKGLSNNNKTHYEKLESRFGFLLKHLSILVVLEDKNFGLLFVFSQFSAEK